MGRDLLTRKRDAKLWRSNGAASTLAESIIFNLIGKLFSISPFYPTNVCYFTSMNHRSLGCVLSLVVSLWAAPLHADEASESNCRRFYDQVDRTISQAGVGDAQETAMKGYPYLRSNRFLTSAVKDADNDERFDFLLQQLMALDQRARRLELSNLPPLALADLERAQREIFPSQNEIPATLDACAKTLVAVDRSRPDAIKHKVRTPDSYSLFKRLLGFYPITAIPFSRGIRKFQAEMTQIYEKNLSEVVRDSGVVFHVPRSSEAIDVAALLRNASDNLLQIPLPSSDQLAQLFARFAPNFAVDTRGKFDLPGAVRWSDGARPNIDPSSTKIYTLASHTRFEGQTLLQLNYVIWFGERPKTGRFDMLGGALDGLIWRVTLAPDGEPLVYDTIHPCGCYHLFFPTDRLRAKPPHPSLQEHAYVPQAAPRLGPGERPTVWVASGSHYIVRLTNTTPGAPRTAIPYELADYDQLRSLPQADGTRRSLFRPNGLIGDTERGERLFFWPMGIASAGAMRQWGHHATAFVGMRHFDDADLIEKVFEPAN